MNVTDSQFDFLSRQLDQGIARHQVIARNVANVNTPGYRRLDVSFEQELTKHGSNESATTAKIVEAPGGTERADGNNVDIEVELGRLDKNALLHSVYTQILASKIATLRSAITGRT